MTIQNIKDLLDACYQGKRVRELLPPLPRGVRPSYVQYLDVIETLESHGVRVKVSDISDTLHLPRPVLLAPSRRWRIRAICEKLHRKRMAA